MRLYFIPGEVDALLHWSPLLILKGGDESTSLDHHSPPNTWKPSLGLFPDRPVDEQPAACRMNQSMRRLTRQQLREEPQLLLCSLQPGV